MKIETAITDHTIINLDKPNEAIRIKCGGKPFIIIKYELSPDGQRKVIYHWE